MVSLDCMPLHPHTHTDNPRSLWVRTLLLRSLLLVACACGATTATASWGQALLVEARMSRPQRTSSGLSRHCFFRTKLYCQWHFCALRPPMFPAEWFSRYSSGSLPYRKSILFSDLWTGKVIFLWTGTCRFCLHLRHNFSKKSGKLSWKSINFYHTRIDFRCGTGTRLSRVSELNFVNCCRILAY